jgi:adenylylsulfate reductase subunit B
VTDAMAETRRKFETPIQLDEVSCQGCGLCVNACPVDVFKWEAKLGKAAVAYPADCCACFLCQDDCPTGAITVNYSRKSPRLFSVYDQLGIKLPDWAK